MKEKYILEIDEIKICVRTDEPKEKIEEIEGTLNRSIRAIHASSRTCQKVEAAIISALDFCSENIELKKKIEMLEAENKSLTRSLELLKRS